MTDISIYDQHGDEVDKLIINDEITFIDGRVSKGTKHYYKGVGRPYLFHHIETPSSEYQDISRSTIFYMGYVASKKCFMNKFGIFQEKYQPIYSDFIGACGVKEGLIVSNSIGFELSSVDVLDCITFDKENKQAYFILNYSCNRKRYIKYGNNPKLLRKLLDYMLQNNWNFLWDKNSISDISSGGKVSDLADIFKSTELKHQLGTVYSVLYSLGRQDKSKYAEFLKFNNMKHDDDTWFIRNSIQILRENNIDISPLLNLTYHQIILNVLMQGKNCGHCSCDFHHEQGEIIKNKYISMLLAEIN